jgi:hypothetical protein
LFTDKLIRRLRRFPQIDLYLRNLWMILEVAMIVTGGGGGISLPLGGMAGIILALLFIIAIVLIAKYFLDG